jgi:hypothetical protein
MAKLETKVENDVFSGSNDECNDVLALLGQANKQINFTQKDFLRPNLIKNIVIYVIIIDPFPRSAKEIEDCSKISNRMFQNRYQRGAFIGRRRPNRFNRGHIGFGRGMMRGRGQVQSYGEPVSASKNLPRQGFRPYRQ